MYSLSIGHRSLQLFLFARADLTAKCIISSNYRS